MDTSFSFMGWKEKFEISVAFRLWKNPLPPGTSGAAVWTVVAEWCRLVDEAPEGIGG